MAVTRYPKPLRRGDRIGVTAPSEGISPQLAKRLDFAVDWLRRQGFEVALGECLIGGGAVSAPARDRAAELMAMLLDPSIHAVVPPFGGELAIELLPHLDFGALGAAEPTWLVGYSDLSTLLVPLTTITGIATLYGHNLMNSPNELPDELVHWTSAAATAHGGELIQRSTPLHSRPHAIFSYTARPRTTRYQLELPGRWRRFDPTAPDDDGAATADHPSMDADRLDVRGRLIGGCIEVLGPIAGAPYADFKTFAARYAAEDGDGLIVYLEACESSPFDIARQLWSLRIAGAFEPANAILIGRTEAPENERFTQTDAIRSALGDLDIPIVLDVDCGHVYPQLSLINGAHAHVVLDGPDQTITQTLD